MIFGSKMMVIGDLLMRLLAPCAVAFLNSSAAPQITGMDAGKKAALIALLTAVNGDNKKVAEAVKVAETEVKKIQGE
jgi:hypothetical protein